MRTADTSIPTPAQARERLARVIALSGLSARAWAESLGRDERTVRRWISGEILIPMATLELLVRAEAAAADVALVRAALEAGAEVGFKARARALEAFERLHPRPVEPEICDPQEHETEEELRACSTCSPAAR